MRGQRKDRGGSPGLSLAPGKGEVGQELTKPNTPLGVLKLPTPTPFMKRIPSSLRQVLLVAGLASLPGLAGAVDLNDLVKHSPFGEAKSATTLSPEPVRVGVCVVELHGTMAPTVV